MTIDIHKMITSNKLTSNLMKPWGSNYDRKNNSKSKSLREKAFNIYTGQGNLVHLQVDFNPKTGDIYKIYDPPSSNDRCSMYYDIKYTVAENVGKNDKDVKRLKHLADDKWSKCSKPRSLWDIAAYSAIKGKRTLGLGVENSNEILSEELHKPKRKNYPRRKIIVNHIDEIFAADLVEMQRFAKSNKDFRYLLTCIDIFSKYSWVIPLKDKKGINVKNALQKISKQRIPKFLWTDRGTELYNKQVQDLLNENDIKLYSTNNSEIKSSVIERFNRTFKNMMYKKFTENNNTIFYNIIDDLVNKYNDKYHSTIKMAPVEGSKKLMKRKYKIFIILKKRQNQENLK